MKKYLLDTSVLVALLKARPGAERLIRPWIAAGEVATSPVVYGEAIEYFKGTANYPLHRAGIRLLLRSVTPLQLTYPIFERYADLRRALRPPRGPGLLGDMDTLIAATALVHGLTLVSLDSDFTRVPELALLHLQRPALM